MLIKWGVLCLIDSYLSHAGQRVLSGLLLVVLAGGSTRVVAPLDLLHPSAPWVLPHVLAYTLDKLVYIMGSN